MENLEITAVFSLGDESCNHRFVFSERPKISFTYPAVYTNERICEHCGRLEQVRYEGITAIEVRKFELVKQKFNKE